jgi:hypothetical protein
MRLFGLSVSVSDPKLPQQAPTDLQGTLAPPFVGAVRFRVPSLLDSPSGQRSFLAEGPTVFGGGGWQFGQV